MSLGFDFAVDAVVLDIEGTTSATGFVVDVLYPYSRSRFAALLSERSADPEVARAVAQVRELMGEPDADAVRVEKALNAWLDEDVKATPLKTLQGLIWSEGFARGDLVSHFYDDVVPALRAWHAAGVRLYVYSSGSVAAQRAWFRPAPRATCRRSSRACTTPRTRGRSRSRRPTAVSPGARPAPRPAAPLPLRPAGRAGRGP